MHDPPCLAFSVQPAAFMEPAASESEVRRQLERFTSRFSDRVAQAMTMLQRSPLQRVRDEALKQCLLYVASATEIATVSEPQIDLLDMIGFVRLCRASLEKYWIPQFYGEEGKALEEAFARSEEELAAIAGRALSESQRNELATLVDAWLAENPDLMRVEWVRLADLSSAAGSAAGDRAARAKGLLSSVRTAAHTADQAMVLSQRALFLVHRLPFLWRLQARLAGREILADGLVHLNEGPEAPIPRMVRQARYLARRAAIGIGLLGGGLLLLRRLGRPARLRT
jgi:hypothetical protein